MSDHDEYFTPGQTIGDYTVLEEIGRGGMGVVYLAQHNYLKKRFAVKVMPRALSERPEFSNLFQQEAQTLGTLRHENIVEVHNFGVHDGSQYLVMEYVEGGTIEDYLNECHKQMPPSEVLATLHAVMMGLQHAHNKNIIHRDLKPENFLLSLDGTVKISDFGLAQLMDAGDSDTAHKKDSSSTMVALYADSLQNEQFTGGTEGYMAPEVAEGGTGDQRADYYAIGVIAYYLLCGEQPTGAYTPVSKKIKGLDKRWDVFIEKCLRHNPDERYQSPEELISDLDMLSTKPRSVAMIAVAVTALLVVALGVLLSMKAMNKPEPTAQQAILPAEPTVESEPPSDEQQANSPAFQAATLAQETTDNKPTVLTEPAQAKSVPPLETATKANISENEPTQKRTPPPIKNASFEQGLNHWDTSGVGDASVVKDPELARSGQHLARILSIRDTGKTTLKTHFEATWRDRLLVGAWLKNERTSRFNNSTATLMLRAVDKYGARIGSKEVEIQTENAWEYATLDIKIGPRAHKAWKDFDHVELHIVLESNAPVLSMLWVDNIFAKVIPLGDEAYTEPFTFPELKKQEQAEAKQPSGKQPTAQASKVEEPPTPKKPAIPDLPEGMAQLTLTVLDAEGNALPPGGYSLLLNGKAFAPLPNTHIFRFFADKEIRFSLEAPKHQPRDLGKGYIKSGDKAEQTYQLLAQ